MADSDDSPTAPPVPEIVDGRYAIKGNVGSGSYSEVHLAVEVATGTTVAVKFEWIYAEKTGKLLQEAQLYQSFVGGVGVPRIYWWGSEGEYNIMVMELLGPSLEDLLDKCGGKLGLKSVLMLGIQLVDRLEYVHSCGIVHRDIKPNNFLIGIGEARSEVYIMDFGLAKKYEDAVTKEHIPCNKKSGLTGTVRYTSLNVHRGQEPSRRDDLGAVGYVLLYLLVGRLPWQGITANSKKAKQRKIARRKEQTTHADLCKGFPHELVGYFEHCDALEFAAVPNYEHLRGLFRASLMREGFKLDGQFDWMGLDCRWPKREVDDDRRAKNKKKKKAAKPEDRLHIRNASARVALADAEVTQGSPKRRRTENCDAVEPAPVERPSFTWHVSAESCAAAGVEGKGCWIESEDFDLGDIPSKFRLRYWPKGHKRASEGSCSAYLWSEEAVTLQVRLRVNNRSKVIDRDGPVAWRAGKDRGYADFCVQPKSGETTLQVDVLRNGEADSKRVEQEEEEDVREYESSYDYESSQYEYSYAEESESEEESEEESKDEDHEKEEESTEEHEVDQDGSKERDGVCE